MPNSSNNNNNSKRDNYLHSRSHATPSHATLSQATPITRAPVYSPPSMWDNIKMGFGASMGSRIFNSIFGDPSVNVHTAPASLAPASLAPVSAALVTYNKCDYLKDEIKLNKCDNEELNSNKCDELFRQMYKCQHNL
jgi:hypothetical protein